ncbi:ORF16 [Fowl aviadenovirus A]|uniref:Uncharacterized protein ORF16 n=2 Tax=Fowl aviadenovirus A TaxID=190061 RepID=YO16_ADEG1|nr:hypothetical protein FAdVAgp28 [Fowl aviadenovirus A]AP_000433.1 ORF16 [Fowl aviadenovirus A]P20744.1 RecName: Full=Uncharacterized protein ORF16 [Fowl aviadenovirus 1]AAC54929.1 ORF16 [Fowl aviadenovirus 1]APP94079.1 hypothetical protein [Fowl aviadenovirus A]APP94112.1 hypothetical protein [Fowl aviadenovirus A]ASU56034.1 ORF16 [Fowl aviadenovirus A]QGQ62313.1 ORF16 [Fowl aviadenovirus A]
MYYFHLRVTLMEPNLAVFHDLKLTVINAWESLTVEMLSHYSVDYLFRLEEFAGVYSASIFLPTHKVDWTFLKRAVALLRECIWRRFECTQVPRGVASIYAVRNTWTPSANRVARHFVKRGALVGMQPCLHECTYERDAC